MSFSSKASASGKRKTKKKKILDPIALERARVEECEKNRVEQLIRRERLKEIIDVEKNMTEVSLKLIEARWISFLRECKQEELIANANAARRTFEQELVQKNLAVSFLSSNLEEIEEQHKLSLRSHMEVVDSLRLMQAHHTSHLEQEFQSDLLSTKKNFELEFSELARNHKNELNDLNLILKNIAEEAELLEKQQQEEISESHETAVEKMEEFKKKIQDKMLCATEEIRKELDQRYKDFMLASQVSMKEYADKSKEDQEITEHIALQLKKIDKLQQDVSSWRLNIARNAGEWEQRNRAMLMERDATLAHLKRLKRKMQNWRRTQARLLTELIKNATTSEKSLEVLERRAESLLRLVQLCKPLETEREQVLRLDTNQTPAEIEQDIRHRLTLTDSNGNDESTLRCSVDEGNTSSSSNWQNLHRFWARHNKVVLDCAAISQEKNLLEQEQQHLKNMLKQYLDDISVNDSVMCQDNALLMCNQIPNVVQLAQDQKKGYTEYNTVVEGNKFISDIYRQMVSS
ncbi:unnamed protein product [Phytomonas sp. Hart1]|nr:unnamed protein product [Phytomonas sp. Hart1]|eukprot:CCW68785.1 unnamed protein product [Phytomonas sp. isolate Hart1]